MDTYVTGITIKTLREKKGLTQTELADILGVSSKAVSKWETAKGLPDISLIEPLANALSVSVMELMTGNTVINKNISSNILRSKFYVCPVCNNIIRTVGDAVISCCGITLPPLDAEDTDENHQITIEKVEDEHFITVNHQIWYFSTALQSSSRKSGWAMFMRASARLFTFRPRSHATPYSVTT